VPPDALATIGARHANTRTRIIICSRRWNSRLIPRSKAGAFLVGPVAVEALENSMARTLAEIKTEIKKLEREAAKARSSSRKSGRW
jgi:hypothetical protein